MIQFSLKSEDVIIETKKESEKGKKTGVTP